MTTPLRLNQTRDVRHSRGTAWRALLLTLALTSCAGHAEFPQDQADAERKAAKDAEIKRQAEWKVKSAAAKAVFDKLCAEQSQPIIKRTVEDVEGVLIMKMRPSALKNYHRLVNDPLWPDAASVDERDSAEGFAEFFLVDVDWNDDRAKSIGDQRRPVGTIGERGLHGYHFVDVLAEDGITRTRISAIKGQVPTTERTFLRHLQITREVTTKPAPRYAYTYENNVDPVLRKDWIAGSTMKIIDTQTGDVIAQQTNWVFDAGFGAAAGRRQVWATAGHRCPEKHVTTMEFVKSVLHPKQR